MCQLQFLSDTPQSSSCIISSSHSSAGGSCIKLIDVTKTLYIISRTAGWKESYDPCSPTGFPCPRKMTPRDTLGHTEALNRRAQVASLGKRWAPPGVKWQSQNRSKSSWSSRPRHRVHAWCSWWRDRGTVSPESQRWKQGAKPEMGSSKGQRNPQGLALCPGQT